MDEKDRLGDKLHEKGKGDEDRFIAQQEREKIEKLRQKLAPAAPRGACPRDGATLQLREEKGVSIDVCPTCHGIWLDAGEMESIFERWNEPWLSRWIRTTLEP